MLVQVLGIIVSFTLTTLTFLGLVNFWLLMIVAILGGLLKGLDMPVRYAIVIKTVDNRADLGNAIALYSLAVIGTLTLFHHSRESKIKVKRSKEGWNYDTVQNS
jgi:MFS family permease